jgi:hypothetical protein
MPGKSKKGGGLMSSPVYKKKSPLRAGIGSYKGEGKFTMPSPLAKKKKK